MECACYNLSMTLKGKRVLITQPMMHWICGSTVVALELAEYLQSEGAKVKIYTCFYDDPIKSICRKKKIQVDEYKDFPNYKLDEFDIVWVHSQVLPLSLVKALGEKLPKEMPAFVFLHMSGMGWIPDEKPWIFDLENRLSSLSLFISEEVKMVNGVMLDEEIRTGYFRNPAPNMFQSRKTKPHDELCNLLIVSNHPPDELLCAKDILSQKYGIEVTLLGEGQEKYELFDLGQLENVDAVITIAKTVSYCLVSRTPVYVYDKFGGGVGWLNEKNFENARKRNFSGYQNSFYPNYEGDGFRKKSANAIAKEIVDGYKAALTYQGRNQKGFLNDFSIDRVLPRILADLETRKDIRMFEARYLESVLAAQSFAERRFEASSIVYNLKHSGGQDDESRLENIELKKALSSRSYRVYKKLISPYEKIKSMKKR